VRLFNESHLVPPADLCYRSPTSPKSQRLPEAFLATATASAVRSPFIRAKHVMFACFVVLMIVVFLTRDRLLFDPNSWLRQRYAPISGLMLLHGIPGALALFLGIFQFSDRLRRRYLQVHRVMGRIYVGCVAIAAPVSIVVSLKLPIPTLAMASVIQTSGWILCTATALYCVRTGRIQQHREWMMRGYPFAMVFVVVRAIVAIPAVARTGFTGLEETVWSVLAIACCLPSFLIEWQKLKPSKRALNAPATAMGD